MTQETVRRLPFRCYTRKGSDLNQSQPTNKQDGAQVVCSANEQTNKMALTPAPSRKCPGPFPAVARAMTNHTIQSRLDF